ncbi:MAG TPA: hypothetical protein VJN88_01280 [Ktedonobacterales bacterium]|nr:hypothetical protein [Ktedonobacterales bacterium]
MREDVVTPATARRLLAEGLAWEPQLGDWVTVLGGEHISETQVGLWLVVAQYPQRELLGLADGAGRWPATQTPTRDCVWLPTAGKLKTWLRARGYRVATGEQPMRLLGGAGEMTRHVCRLTRTVAAPPIDGEGINEAEAVADAALKVLGAQTSDSPRGVW